MAADAGARRVQLDLLMRLLDAELRASAGLADTAAEIALRGPPGLGGRWLLLAQGGAGCVRELAEMDRAEGVQCTVTSDIDTLARLAAGTLKPAMAVLRGKVSYKGSYAVLRNLREPMQRAVRKAIAEIGPDGLGDHLAGLAGAAEARGEAAAASAEWAEGLTFVLDESHPEWVQDAAASRCKVCLTRFGFLFRRHHCRLCGSVVCSTCSQHRLKGRRVCTLCFQARVGPSSRRGGPSSAASDAGSEAGSAASPRGRKPSSARPQAPAATGMLPFERLLAHIQRLQDRPIAATVQSGAASLLATTRSLLLKVRGLQNTVAEHEQSSLRQTLLRAALSALPAAIFLGISTLCWRSLMRSLLAGGQFLNPFRGILALGVIITTSHRVLPNLASIGLAGLLVAPSWSPAAGAELASALTSAACSTSAWWAIAYQLVSTHPVYSVLILGGAVLANLALRFFGRLFRIYSFAMTIILTYWSVNAMCSRMLGMSEAATTRVLQSIDRVVAPFACQQILELRSVFVKFGQYIGSRADIIPPLWGNVLAKLQDDMPADSPEYVEKALEEAFGAKVSDIFEEFDYTPLASASVAQVHRGVIRAGVCPIPRGNDGRLNGTDLVEEDPEFVETELEVAVKVQHEGIEAIMRSDIVAFSRIVRFIAWLNPRLEIANALLKAWEKEMLKELDFRVEAENLHRVRANMRKAGLLVDNDLDYADTVCVGSQVLVPRPVHAFTAKRAFCMTFIHGFKITDLEQLDLFGVDRCALVKRVVHAYSNQLYVDGFFNADPHAGNLMVSISEDGTARPVLLDFGMAVTIPEKQRIGYSKLLYAVSSLSISGVSEAIAYVGYKNSQSDLHPERDLEFFSFLLRDTGDRKTQRATSARFRKRRKEQRKRDLEIDPNKEGRFFSEMPDSLVFLFRVLGLIRGLCTTLLGNASISYIEIMGDYARLGLVHHQLALAAEAPRRQPVPRPVPVSLSGLGPKALALQGRVEQILARYARGSGNGAEAGGAVVEEGFVVEDIVGAQICCLVKGQPVVDAHAGVLDELGPQRVQADSLFPLLDLSRVLPTLLLLRLYDNSKLSMADLVTKYWPAFYHKKATVADVLSYSAQLEDLIKPTSPVARLRDMAGALALLENANSTAAASAKKGGTGAAQYQVFTHGFVLAGLIQHILGETSTDVADLIRSQLLAPHSVADALYLSAAACPTDRLATASNGFAKFIRGFVMGGQPPPAAMMAASAGAAEGDSAGGITSKGEDDSVGEWSSQSASSDTSPAEQSPVAAPVSGSSVMDQMRLPAGVVLDPCCVNAEGARTSTIPSFAAFGTARGLAELVHKGMLKGLSKRVLRELAGTPISQENSPLFGAWRWTYGFQVYELDSASAPGKKRKVLCHHAFGGSLLVVVPELEIVLSVLVNCLTLDRTATREIAEAVLADLDAATSVGPIFAGMF